MSGMSLLKVLCGALLGFYAVCGDLYTSEIACEDGWLKANNNCYYWNVKDLITYQEARQECQLQGADLMVVGSQSELQWIQIQTEDYRTDAWWVGLNIDSTGIWNWVTGGGDNSIIKWRNEPDNYDDQDCGAINEFGKFGDEYCDSLFGFICKYVINRNEYCPDGPGWFPLDTGCFYVSDLLNSSQRLSWDDASTYCGNLVPGRTPVLLFINNMDEKNFIASQLQNSDPNGVMVPWWTGLNDIITEGKYTWQNGTLANMSLITWDSAPAPDRSLHQDCGIMYFGGVIDDMVCSKQAHYVCEKSAFVAHLNLGCGSWLRGGHSCYLMAKGKGYNWQDARARCQRAGADLLKVDNKDEKNWLQSLQIGGIGYWTGLNDMAVETHFVWADGKPADSSLINWSEEPNNYAGNENCVEIHRDGKYNDLSCIAKAGYICELVTDAGAPCPSGWVSQGSECYYFSSTNLSAVLTWYEVEDKCNDLSQPAVSHRLAVSDVDEQTWIKQQLLNQPPNSAGYWTGLNDIQSEGTWSYSNPAENPANLDLIEWGGEPNDHSHAENCGVMYEGGFYNDLDCNAKAFYICEKNLYGNNVAASSKTPSNKTVIITAFVGVLITIFQKNNI